MAHINSTVAQAVSG